MIVQLANGKYQARYSSTEGGKRTRPSRTFDLRNEAEWWLSQAKRHGEAPEDVKVAAYLEGWLKGKRKVAASTRVLYENHVGHITAVLGGYRLADLRRRHIESFVDDRLAYVSPQTKRPLTPRTVAKVLVTLRSALEAAVPHQIPENPASRVEGPRVELQPVRAMTREDAAALVEAVRGTWMEHPVRVLLGSGMRVGEAVALNQGDVHDGWVSLRKSKTTLRRVDLSADADAAIHEAIRKAPRRGRGEPVFFGVRGDRLRGDSLYHAMKRTLATHPHAMRHGAASLMIAGGVHMRVVQEQLGHADMSTTQRTYSHVAPTSIRDALGVLDEAVK